MGFDFKTLLSLPLGLLLPVIIVIYMMSNKKNKKVAFDSIFIGFGAFLASLAAVAVVFILFNTVFLTGLKFSDDTSGLTIVGVIISALLIALFVVCESFKLSTIKKFVSAETPLEFSAMGFSAGVIVAQNIVVFVVNNILGDLETFNIIFFGLILLVTGIMYTVLSIACESMVAEGFKTPAYAISAVYYLFWVAVIVFVQSSTLIYIATAFLFVLSFVLSGVFLFRLKKKSLAGDDK